MDQDLPGSAPDAATPFYARGRRRPDSQGGETPSHGEPFGQPRYAAAAPFGGGLAAPPHPMLAAMGGTPAWPPELDELPLSPERSRQEHEHDLFNEVFLLAPVAYFVLAFDTAILQMNLAAAELLAMSREQAEGHQFRSFVCQRFQADFDHFVRRALNSSRAERIQLQMARTSHEQGFPVTLLASADSSGQAFRVVVELAEGSLAPVSFSEERLRRVVHSAEEGIWEIDADGCTSFVNPKMAQMLGYSIEAMLGRPLVAFMDEEGRGLLERNITRRQQGMPERHEFKFLRQDGAELWVTLATHPIVDAAGVYQGALALATDITERKESSELMWQQANFDELTGLPNRHMFLDRLDIEVKKARREEGGLALLFVDLDDFKKVNDNLGHDHGDALLVEAAQRMAACVRATDTVARLGGDEFTVLLPGLEHIDSVERVAQQLIASLQRPFALNGHKGLVSASVGIALYPADAADVEALLRHADQAMYAAKAAGRNRYSYFTADLQAAAQLRVRTTLDLREALASDQFELHYQPIVNLQTGRVERAEALLRWNNPERGLLRPADFLPFAESSGLIIDIGDWVFREAARQVRRWQQTLDPRFQISVNKSPVQFRSDALFYQGWTSYLAELELPPRSLVIEIGESILLGGAKGVLERLQAFHAMGLQVALEHFGTGCSSLSHLKTYDIDFVKIDQSFVQGVEEGVGDLALCEAIIAVAHKLGLKVVAEGVETVGQRDALRLAGCDYAQGYVFAQAMPAGQFAAMAAQTRQLAN